MIEVDENSLISTDNQHNSINFDNNNDVNVGMKRKKESPVHNYGYFTSVADENGKITKYKQYHCQVDACKTVVICKNGQTSNAIRHLEVIHNILGLHNEDKKEKVMNNKEISTSSYTAMAIKYGLDADSGRFQNLQRALITIDQNLPMNHFEKKTVREFHPGAVPICRETVACCLLEYFLQWKKERVDESTKNY